MSKEQIVSDAMSAFQAAQLGVLGEVYDKSFAEGVASVPPADADEQAKIDAAVAAAVGPLNEQLAALQVQDDADKQAAVDAKAAGDAAVAALQAQFDVLAAKEGQEAAVVDGLKNSLSILQDVVAKLAALPALP